MATRREIGSDQDKDRIKREIAVGNESASVCACVYVWSARRGWVVTAALEGFNTRFAG